MNYSQVKIKVQKFLEDKQNQYFSFNEVYDAVVEKDVENARDLSFLVSIVLDDIKRENVFTSKQ